MYNKNKIIALLGIFSTCSLVPSGRDTMTCSNVVAGTNQNVRGQETNCTGGDDQDGLLEGMLNSFKDKVNWTIKRGTPKKDLGKITENQSVEIKYPAISKMNIVSFTPTEGNAKNKKVELLFVAFSIYDQKKNMAFPDENSSAKANLEKQLAALKDAKSPFNNLIKIYRKIGTEKQWEERAEVYSKESPDSETMITNWIIMPNGMAKSAEKLFRTDVNGVTTEYDASAIDLTSME
ncbi:hypothetical protein EKK58_01775 [Candidatus Dependentiae bacterium]|nr:MAG: hypothetical protein EKK58_01775 [Candidatus Dependentiae bacterium]